MNDTIRQTLGVMALVAVTIVILVSMMFNVRFADALAGDLQIDKAMLRAAVISTDVLKGILPLALVWCYTHKKWQGMLASALLLVIVSAYSVTAALGYSSYKRFAFHDGQEVSASNARDTRADLDRFRAELANLPPHRTMGEVEADLIKMHANYRWNKSNFCNRPRGPNDRRYCQEYRKLKAEFAVAQRKLHLEEKIDANQPKLAGVKNITGDAQVKLFMHYFGGDPQGWVAKFSVLLAAVVEFVSTFGFTAVLFFAFPQSRVAKVVGITKPAPVIAPDPAKGPNAVSMTLSAKPDPNGANSRIPRRQLVL